MAVTVTVQVTGFSISARGVVRWAVEFFTSLECDNRGGRKSSMRATEEKGGTTAAFSYFGVQLVLEKFQKFSPGSMDYIRRLVQQLE